jgi:hypothetical protein
LIYKVKTTNSAGAPGAMIEQREPYGEAYLTNAENLQANILNQLG